LVVRELLRQKFTTSQIRKVVVFLNKQGYESPLTEFTFAVEDDQIFFQYEDGTWAGSKRNVQLVFRQTLNLRLLREEIWRSVPRPRTAQDKGHFERRRKVQGHQRVFRGTRVPVAAVIRYINEGIPEREILAAYPTLTRSDVRAARGEAKLAVG
jgi:uncharacterized protein (DUF433 family)